MKCPDCGKEMEFIAELTEEEKFEIKAYETKLEMATSLTALNVDFSKMESDEQVLEYLKAVFESYIEVKYKDICEFRKLKAKYAPEINLANNEIRFIDGKMYKHPL